jgi:hypothetical protein
VNYMPGSNAQFEAAGSSSGTCAVVLAERIDAVGLGV